LAEHRELEIRYRGELANTKKVETRFKEELAKRHLSKGKADELKLAFRTLKIDDPLMSEMITNLEEAGAEEARLKIRE
jgi:hypothetical protein